MSDSHPKRPSKRTGSGRTLGDAFRVEPEQWGLRGDPHVWAAMRDYLSDTPVPVDQSVTQAVLKATFAQVVGVNLDDPDLPDAVYRDEFAHGGMSSGQIDLSTWQQRLIPLLAAQAART